MIHPLFTGMPKPFRKGIPFLLAFFLLFPPKTQAQTAFEDQYGAWYMYFWNAKKSIKRFGFQGDLQHRSWNLGSDLEQLMLRGGVTYSPKSDDVLLTQGYARIISGSFGSSKNTQTENRVYQEALIPQMVMGRFNLTHRFRFEQRWVAGQDFRTRYRYNLFLNIPLNNPQLIDKTVYLALYNELFINGQRDIGTGTPVELFDRNRFYSAIGFKINSSFKVQLGNMIQTTDNWEKNQFQLSLHHSM